MEVLKLNLVGHRILYFGPHLFFVIFMEWGSLNLLYNQPITFLALKNGSNSWVERSTVHRIKFLAQGNYTYRPVD